MGYTFLGWSENEGDPAIEVSIEKGSTGNRTFVAQWEEDPNQRLAATITAYEGVYDGEDHAIIDETKVFNENELDIEGATITYSIDGGESFQPEMPMIQDAGEYPVVVRIEKDGFISYEEEVTAIIEKAEALITVDNKTKTVGAEDPSFSATVEGLFGEDAITYELVREDEGETVGTYTIGATVETHNNYDVSVEEGTLTIVAASDSDSTNTDTTPTTPTTPDTTPIEEANVPTTPVPAQVLPAQVTPIQVTPAQEEEQQVVEIEEDIVPQAQTVDETVTIDEDNVPLAVEPTSKNVWALFNLILAIITVATSVVLLMGYFANKKKEDELEEEGENSNNKKGMIRTFSVIPAIAAVIVFVLTENMLNPMVLVDKWTLTMVAIALAQVVVAFASRKKADDEDDTEAFAQ